MLTLQPQINGSGELPKGHWKLAHTIKAEQTARISCPGCGRSVYLDPDLHSITETGEVSPSLVCPHNCGFHDYVTLGGWGARSDRIFN